MNEKGKIVTFTDGTRLDMKTVTEQDELITFERLPVRDVLVTFNEDFQLHAMGLDGNNKQVVASMDSLRRSINLFGQVQPILVSVTKDPVKESFKAVPDQKYQIIDGLKRYAIAVDSGRDDIKAIVINKVIKDKKSIIRFLSNQSVLKSPESLIDEANFLRNRTESLQESFIEQALNIEVGSLESLVRAFESDDPDKKKLIEKYRDGMITIKELIKRLEKKDRSFDKTKRLMDQYAEQSEKIGKANESLDRSVDLDKNTVRQTDLDKLDDKFEMDNRKDGFKKDASRDDYHESSVNDAEDHLRAKQQRNREIAAQLEKKVQDSHDEQQFVGERKPLDKATRMAVLSRDQNRCQCCGLGGVDQPSLVATFEIHHLVDVQLGGTDKLDNLVLLCKQCHSLITNYTRAFPNKPHPSFVPPYNPTQEELDVDPNKWIIPLLGSIESEGYKEAFDQIYNYDSKIAKEIKTGAITIGQGIKKLKDKLVIKHKIDARHLFEDGLVGLYLRKKDSGFEIYNDELGKTAEEEYVKKFGGGNKSVESSTEQPDQDEINSDEVEYE